MAAALKGLLVELLPGGRMERKTVHSGWITKVTARTGEAAASLSGDAWSSRHGLFKYHKINYTVQDESP